MKVTQIFPGLVSQLDLHSNEPTGPTENTSDSVQEISNSTNTSGSDTPSFASTSLAEVLKFRKKKTRTQSDKNQIAEKTRKALKKYAIQTDHEYSNLLVGSVLDFEI